MGIPAPEISMAPSALTSTSALPYSTEARAGAILFRGIWPFGQLNNVFDEIALINNKKK